jgi:hypothetical protein
VVKGRGLTDASELCGQRGQTTSDALFDKVIGINLKSLTRSSSDGANGLIPALLIKPSRRPQ